MFNIIKLEKSLSIITSVSGAKRTKKQKNGESSIENILKVKIESACIDYDNLKVFNSVICASLLNIQPMPFKSQNFDYPEMNLKANIYATAEDENQSEMIKDSEPVISFKIEIKDIKVVNKENIPVFTFLLECPSVDRAEILLNLIKAKVEFEIEKMEVE